MVDGIENVIGTEAGSVFVARLALELVDDTIQEMAAAEVVGLGGVASSGVESPVFGSDLGNRLKQLLTPVTPALVDTAG